MQTCLTEFLLLRKITNHTFHVIFFHKFLQRYLESFAIQIYCTETMKMNEMTLQRFAPLYLFNKLCLSVIFQMNGVL